MDTLAGHPSAVLAPEVFDRDRAFGHVQPGVVARDRVRIDVNGASAVATDHRLAGGQLK